MNTGLLQQSRRWVMAMIIIAMVAITTAYGPALLEEMAGVSISTPVYACNPPGGGC